MPPSWFPLYGLPPRAAGLASRNVTRRGRVSLAAVPGLHGLYPCRIEQHSLYGHTRHIHGILTLYRYTGTITPHTAPRRRIQATQPPRRTAAHSHAPTQPRTDTPHRTHSHGAPIRTRRTTGGGVGHTHAPATRSHTHAPAAHRWHRQRAPGRHRGDTAAHRHGGAIRWYYRDTGRTIKNIGKNRKKLLTYWTICSKIQLHQQTQPRHGGTPAAPMGRDLTQKPLVWYIGTYQCIGGLCVGV